MERVTEGSRRRFPRFPLASAVEAGDADWQRSWAGWATDLGCGGLRLSIPDPLPEGRRLFIRLQLAGRSLVREAEVVWTGLRAALAGPVPGRPHGLKFLVPLPAAIVRTLTLPRAPERAAAPPQERTFPLDTVSLPDVPIAGGGLFVRCRDPLPLGSPVCLHLLLPQAPALHLGGRVVWENPGGRNPFPPGMGVQILECPPQERPRLAGLLERELTPGQPGMVEAWYAVRSDSPPTLARPTGACYDPAAGGNGAVLPGNPKGLAKDIAEGFFALTPLVLRKLTPPELKTISQNLNIVLRETRSEATEPGNAEGVRRKSLRIQRLNQALLVLTNYCKHNRVPI